MSNYRKIAVIADIHGNSWALEAVLEDIQKNNITEIVNLGDIFYGPLDPANTYTLITKYNIRSISGNMERYLLEVTTNKIDTPTIPLQNPTMEYVVKSFTEKELQWIQKLPTNITTDANIYMCHGNPISDDSPLIEKITADGVIIKTDQELIEEISAIPQKVILCTHTHIARHTQLSNESVIINPGSVGLPAYTDDFPYPHKMESLSPFARYCILELDNNGNLTINQKSIKYDWEKASQTAQKNNRPDWAKWLKYGKD